jgi:hypothetical protein
MKLFALISLIFLSAPAFAKTVEVSCMCTYQSDYLIQPPILVSGKSSKVTDDDLKDCKIVDAQGNPTPNGKWGKIVGSAYDCGLAAMNAQFNCEQQVRASTGLDSLKRPNAYVDGEGCFGQISE